MSFFLTVKQFRDRTKDVTRRLGWEDAEPGEVITGILKGQGLKKGEKQEELGQVEVVSVRRERVDAITQEDVVREGFPEMTPAEFIAMFCRANGCGPDRVITRIEFRYV